MTKEIGFSSKFDHAVSLAAEVQLMKVTDAECHRAVDLKLAQIRALEADLEGEWAQHPTNLAYKELARRKRDLAAILEDTRKIKKQEQIAWEEAQEQARQEAEQALHEQMLKDAGAYPIELGGPEPIVPQVIVPKTTPTTRSQVRWDFKIENANAIPRQFLTPDLTAIRRVVTALKGACQIPGISVFSRKV